MALPDMVQRFLPCPVPCFDRARYLEEAFSNGYKDYATGALTDSGIYHLCPPGDLPHIPNLFFNCTHVETGRKAIISNIRLSKTFFIDELDVLDTIQQDIPLKVIVSCSSRFPLATSPALLCSKSNQELGHIVDGGYYDNSAVETCMELAYAITDKARQLKQPVRIKIIGIANCFKPNTFKTLKIYEAAPGMAFYNAWNRRQISMQHLAEKMDSSVTFSSIYTLVPDPGGVEFPLGWCLSGAAKKKMKEQAMSKNP
jgi:hypothetical protein